jgi:hypothetical protein
MSCSVGGLPFVIQTSRGPVLACCVVIAESPKPTIGLAGREWGLRQAQGLTISDVPTVKPWVLRQLSYRH